MNPNMESSSDGYSNVVNFTFTNKSEKIYAQGVPLTDFAIFGYMGELRHYFRLCQQLPGMNHSVQVNAIQSSLQIFFKISQVWIFKAVIQFCTILSKVSYRNLVRVNFNFEQSNIVFVIFCKL